MGRAGSFSANFDQAVLDGFRALCRSQGRQYTKVLEQLAALYLETDGQVLTAACSLRQSVPGTGALPTAADGSIGALNLQGVLERVEQLELNGKETEDSIRLLFDRLIALEKKFQSKSKV